MSLLVLKGETMSMTTTTKTMKRTSCLPTSTSETKTHHNNSKENATMMMLTMIRVPPNATDVFTKARTPSVEL